MKTYNFCNNCGKGGHSFHQCKIPITSLGIITFRKIDDELQYLLICRKDSLGYVDFLRGRYDIDNKDYIMNIINIMTNIEKENLLTKPFTELWKDLWGDFIGIQYRGEEKLSQSKFESLKNGVTFNNMLYTLEDLINESKETWDDPEWGFPKGRRNFQEKDFDCALREYIEETGYTGDNLNIVANILPYEENFTGSNYKSYKHKYYIGEMHSETESDTHFQTTEVSKLLCVSYDDAVKLIRPYNLERLNVLKKVNNVLQQYRLYS